MGEFLDKVKGKARQVMSSLTGRAKHAEEVTEEKKEELKEKIDEFKRGIRPPK